MFFGRSGYGYRSYSFPNPLYLLPSLERDYKYIIYYLYRKKYTGRIKLSN